MRPLRASDVQTGLSIPHKCLRGYVMRHDVGVAHAASRPDADTVVGSPSLTGQVRLRTSIPVASRTSRATWSHTQASSAFQHPEHFGSPKHIGGPPVAAGRLRDQTPTTPSPQVTEDLINEYCQEMEVQHTMDTHCPAWIGDYVQI